MTPALKRLQRRLERAELELLRNHVVELDAKLEAAERRAYDAERCADLWHDQALSLQEQVEQEDPPFRQIGLTKSGELLVIATPAEQH